MADSEIKRSKNKIPSKIRTISDTAEEFYFRLLDKTNDWIIVVDRDLKIVYVNEPLCNSYGYKAAEISGKNLRDIVGPDGQKVNPFVASTEGEQGFGLFETIHTRRDGSMIPVEVNISSIKIGDRELLVNIIRDITDRKSAESALRSSEENYRNSVENSPLGIRVATNNDETIYANKAMLEIYGYDSINDFNAIPRKQRFTPESYSALSELQEKEKRGENIPSDHEISILRKDGEIRHLSVTRGDVLWNGVMQSEFIYQDITDQRKTKQELILQANLLDSQLDGVIVHDLDGKIVYINGSACNFFGYPRESLFNKNLKDFTESGAPFPAVFDALFKKGTYSFEVVHKKRDGSTIPLDIHAHIIESNNRKLILSVARDITEIKKAEKTLKESERRLNEAQSLGKIADYEIDLDTQNFIWSNEMYVLFERDRQLLPPDFQEILDYFTPQESERYSRLGKNVVEKGIELRDDFTAKLPSGKTPVFNVRIRPVKNAAGRTIKLFGTIQDITERKRAEEAIQRSEENFRNSMDKSPTGIIVTDESHEIYYYNEAFLYMHGSNTIDEFKTVPPEILNNVNYLSSSIENTIRHKNGKLRYLSITKGEIFWDGNKRVQMVFQDITEAKISRQQLDESFKKLQQTFEGVIKVLSATVALRDAYTASHQLRVAHLARAIADEMNLTEEHSSQIYTAALIHDIGKMSIPAEILSKPSDLSSIERSFIQMHPQAGYEIINNIGFSYPVARWMLEHHERLNGSGYPNGLTAEQISFEAKILAVADVVEAMSSHRPFRPSLGVSAALEEITKNKNILYDGKIADSCFRLFYEKGFKFD